LFVGHQRLFRRHHAMPAPPGGQFRATQPSTGHD